MSSVASSISPCLVAILLVCNTRTGSGAQIIYHYPPQLLSNQDTRSSTPSSFYEGESSSSDTDASSSDNDIYRVRALPGRIGARQPKARLKSVSDDDLDSSDNNNHETRTSRSLFGLAEHGLVSLLTPDRTWHKRRFELGINDLTFVGRPVFVKQDGSWSKRRKSRRRTARVEDTASDTASASEDEHASDQKPMDKDNVAAPKTAEGKSQLTMFHVVFVMNPPPLEHNTKVKDMYDHVIKKFSRALKWEQVHNDYVWKQSEIILSAKGQTSSRKISQSQLSKEIVQRSSLATAMSIVYNAITSSNIASITLSPKVTISLQIPPVTSTSYLPSLTDPPIQPGLWLTTATDLGSTASENDANSPTNALQLSKHYTLLLKHSPQRIARDAQEAGGALAQHLPKFLTALRPTKSFYKLSAALQMSLADVQLFARHLIYWRRAIAIPPLHQRDTYIVSPNANMSKLREAIKSYESQFPPTMPSLPKMLSALSGIPRPYGMLIPSSDHKEMYYFALAWLMRNGWVTQLRSFAYVRVDPEIKRQVRDTERDNRLRSLQNTSNKDIKDDVKDSIRPRPKRPSIVSRPSSDGRKSHDGARNASNPKMANLILNPPRASAEESRWLECIGENLYSKQDLSPDVATDEEIDLQKYWPMFIRYFNGRIALETIPVRENLKLKFVWAVLERMGMNTNRGLEDEESRSKTLLLTVQHW